MDTQIKIQHEIVKGEVLIGAINTFQKNRVFVAFLDLLSNQANQITLYIIVFSCQHLKWAKCLVVFNAQI